MSSIYEFLNFFEFGQVRVHLIAHTVVQFVEKDNHAGDHFAFVLIHELIHEGKHVLEQKLLSLLMNLVSLFSELVQQIYSRFGQRVQNPMSDVL
jgi:hypothetical protein